MKQIIAERFSKLFRGLPRAYGIFNPKIQSLPGTKVKGRYSTIAKEITSTEWESHLKGEQSIGIVPIRDNGTCWWGAIDIDINDINHISVFKKVQKLELPLTVCESKSGGAHLYLFMTEPCDAVLIRKALIKWSILLGYTQAEIFPKQEQLATVQDIGNWINIPYFNGLKHNGDYPYGQIKDDSELISKKTIIRAGYNHRYRMRIAEFLDYADTKKISVSELIGLVAKIDYDQVMVNDFDDAPPCLRAIITNGIKKGTRNNVLFNLGVYARKKFDDDWARKLTDYNQNMIEPSIGLNELQSIIESVSNKNYYYKCNDQPLINFCNKTICKEQKYGISGDAEMTLIIDNLQKLDIEPPSWFVNVNGKRIELTNTMDLLSQAKFSICCVEKLHILPPLVKDKIWRKLITALLEQVEIIDAPDDASKGGLLIYYLHDFCTGRVQAQYIEELNQDKPYHDEKNKRYYFKIKGFIAFLHSRRFLIALTEIYKILKMRYGVKDYRLHKVGRVWGIDEDILNTMAINDDDEQPDDAQFNNDDLPVPEINGNDAMIF